VDLLNVHKESVTISEFLVVNLGTSAISISPLEQCSINYIIHNIRTKVTYRILKLFFTINFK
jgi:hypothetical protein